MEDKELIIAFWNCSQAPPISKFRKGFRSDIDTEAALLIINILFLEKKVDFLGLCEINEDVLNYFVDKLNERVEGYFCGEFFSDETETRGLFDIGYICINKDLSVEHINTVTNRFGHSQIKVAQEFVLCIGNEISSDQIKIFVSHWPSDKNGNKESHRGQGAEILRNEMLNNYDQFQCIAMGDYNASPLNRIFFDRLKSTNDRSLVKSAPDFWTYNPFWKALAPRVPFSIDESRHDFGTYYYKATDKESWHTVDHMIFSGGFLGNHDWFIEESKTQVVSDKDIIDLVMDAKLKIDHLPIISCIKRK